jgi:hypothetical protein
MRVGGSSCRPIGVFDDQVQNLCAGRSPLTAERYLR